MSLDLKKIRERVEEAIDLTSELLVRREMQVSHYEFVDETTTRPVFYEQPVPVGQHADPMCRLLDILHILNVLELEERNRFPIVTAEGPGTGEALKPYIPLDLMGLAHDVVQAAIALRDFWQGAGINTNVPPYEETAPGPTLCRVVDAYKKAVNQ